MNATQLDFLQRLAAAFRDAVEQARAERDPAALPYFPEGACRMTSRLFAQYTAAHTDPGELARPLLVSGILAGSELGVRHFWLEFDGTVVDLTADPFGEPRVVVGPPSAFHRSLTERIAAPADEVTAALGADETARLTRQLAAIEARLPASDPSMSAC